MILNAQKYFVIVLFQMQGKLDKLEEHLPKNVCRCCPFNIGIQELVPTLKKNRKLFFEVMDMKRLHFLANCWFVKFFYRLSTKLKKKYRLLHENNLKSNLQIQNSNFNVKKMMIGYISYLKQICFPSLPHTQNFVPSLPNTQNLFKNNLPNHNCFYVKVTCNILLI